MKLEDYKRLHEAMEVPVLVPSQGVGSPFRNLLETMFGKIVHRIAPTWSENALRNFNFDSICLKPVHPIAKSPYIRYISLYRMYVGNDTKCIVSVHIFELEQNNTYTNEDISRRISNYLNLTRIRRVP